MSWEPSEFDERPMALRAWHILSRWIGDFPDHEAALLAARRLRAEGIPVASVEIEIDGQQGEIVAVLLNGTEVRFPGDGPPSEGVRIADDLDAEIEVRDVPVLGCEECERRGQACPDHMEDE